MFPLQRSCELSFQLSEDKDIGHHSDPNPQQYHFVSDFTHPGGSLNPIINGDDDNNNSAAGCRRRRRSFNGGERCEMDNSKRVIHRETERQRRLEMASHYSSLRNLLPDHYVKGKKSMSDHIMETGKYIKDLENRIKEKKSKQEKLKGSVGTANIHRSPSSPPAGERLVVSVERCSEGVEIKICCGSPQEVPLSRLLSVITEQGLDVVNCVSTHVKRCFVHVIHAQQMKDMLSIDPSWLQRRLLNEIWSCED